MPGEVRNGQRKPFDGRSAWRICVRGDSGTSHLMSAQLGGSDAESPEPNPNFRRNPQIHPLHKGKTSRPYLRQSLRCFSLIQPFWRPHQQTLNTHVSPSPPVCQCYPTVKKSPQLQRNDACAGAQWFVADDRILSFSDLLTKDPSCVDAPLVSCVAVFSPSEGLVSWPGSPGTPDRPVSLVQRPGKEDPRNRHRVDLSSPA